MKSTLIHTCRKIKLLIVIATIMLLINSQIKSQDTNQEIDAKGKFVLMGNFGYNSNKYEYKHYGALKEEKGIKAYINPRFGFFASNKMIIGFGLGFTFLEKYPQLTLIYEQWNKETGGVLESRIISRKDLSTSLFIRYQNKLTNKLNFYIDFEAGMDFNLYYKSHYYSHYGNAVSESNDFFSKLSNGVILNLNKSLALQSEIISFRYRADFKKGGSKPFSTLNLEYIFSNPNIGLVFYF